MTGKLTISCETFRPLVLCAARAVIEAMLRAGYTRTPPKG
jgi:hypothetical protein